MFTNPLISNLRAWHNRGLVSRELSAMSDRQVVNELLSSCLAYLQWQEV